MESVTLTFTGDECQTDSMHAMLGRDSLCMLLDISNEIRSTLKHGKGEWKSEKLEQLRKDILDHLARANWQ